MEGYKIWILQKKPVLVFIVLSLPVDVYPAMLGHDSVLLGLS